MNLTPLGWVFIPLLLAVSLGARRWLPGLVAFSTVLQGASVLDVPAGVGYYGVSPFVCAALAAGVALVGGGVAPGAQRGVRVSAPMGWLLALLGLGIVGACLLPLLFGGVPVYSLLNRVGFDAPLSPLQLGISNVAQAANAGLIGVVLIYFVRSAQRPGWKPRYLLGGWAAGVALVVAIGVYERFALAGLLPTTAPFWMSNPGYSQAVGAEVAGVLRISAPFSEPSYGSTYLAASFAGLAAVAAFGRKAMLALLAAALVGASLLNTLGSTGVAAAAITLVAIAALLSLRCVSGAAEAKDLARRSHLAWAGGLLVVVVLAYGVVLSPFSETASDVIEKGVIDKLVGEQSLSTTSRLRANAWALEVLQRTNGLGAGLGSNRASSYVASLASNLGLPGMLLWLAALASILRRHARVRLEDHQVFCLWALVGATVGMIIGVPDLNLPLYWVIMGAAALLAPTVPE